jgi:hypothetical protein
VGVLLLLQQHPRRRQRLHSAAQCSTVVRGTSRLEARSGLRPRFRGHATMCSPCQMSDPTSPVACRCARQGSPAAYLHHCLVAVSLHLQARKGPCLLGEHAAIIHGGQQRQAVLQADLQRNRMPRAGAAAAACRTWVHTPTQQALEPQVLAVHQTGACRPVLKGHGSTAVQRHSGTQPQQPAQSQRRPPGNPPGRAPGQCAPGPCPTLW